jgi:hypothetical protein
LGLLESDLCNPLFCFVAIVYHLSPRLAKAKSHRAVYAGGLRHIEDHLPSPVLLHPEEAAICPILSRKKRPGIWPSLEKGQLELALSLHGFAPLSARAPDWCSITLYQKTVGLSIPNLARKGKSQRRGSGLATLCVVRIKYMADFASFGKSEKPPCG